MGLDSPVVSVSGREVHEIGTVLLQKTIHREISSVSTYSLSSATIVRSTRMRRTGSEDNGTVSLLRLSIERVLDTDDGLSVPEELRNGRLLVDLHSGRVRNGKVLESLHLSVLDDPYGQSSLHRIGSSNLLRDSR